MKKALIAAAMLVAADAQATLYVNGFLATGNVATNFPVQVWDDGVYSGTFYAISFGSNLQVRLLTNSTAYIEGTAADGNTPQSPYTNLHDAASAAITNVPYILFNGTNGFAIGWGTNRLAFQGTTNISYNGVSLRDGSGSGATQAIATVGSSVVTSTISGATLSWSNSVVAGGGTVITDVVFAVRNIGQFYASAAITTQSFPTALRNDSSVWNTNTFTWTPTGTGIGHVQTATYLTNNASGGRITLFHYVNGVLRYEYHDSGLAALNDIKLLATRSFVITNAADVHSFTFYNVGGMGAYDGAPDLNNITLWRNP